MTTVLKLATEKAGWGRTRPRGEGQGFAITQTMSAYVAIVADVVVSREGELAIKKITAAVDAGTIINLSAAEAQVQGAILDGISAAWFQKITIERGAAAQTNFDDYPMLRMNDSPPARGGSLRQVRRAADRIGRAWSSRRRAGGLQRDLRRDGQARAHAAHRRREFEMVMRALAGHPESRSDEGSVSIQGSSTASGESDPSVADRFAPAPSG